MGHMETTIAFLRAAYRCAEHKGKRGWLDIFADRLIRATSEPTLAAAMEALIGLLHVPPGAMPSAVVTRMIALTGEANAPRVLRWLREQPKLIAMIVGERDETAVAEVLEMLELPSGATSAGRAAPRRSYMIRLHATCETPLAHGAEGKAGNATIFRRIQVMTDNGVLHLPYYSGNAIRGQMRDLLADHFLRSLGVPADRAQPAIALWFFYALYSGGALEEKSSAMKAIRKEVGDHGALRGDGIRAFRSHLPALSLLGCALGNRVLPGRIQVGDLRPVCREWGTGEQPIAEMMTWEWLTRREDHEDHEEHHGMIASTEVLRAGAQLEGGIDHDIAIAELERAALGRGVALLAERGMLGAENRRGMGRVVIEAVDAPDPAPYDEWLASERESILAYLRDIEALA